MDSAARDPQVDNSFLTAAKWERIYGEQYEKWRKERWVGSSHATQSFLNHAIPLGSVDDRKILLPHQAEAIQRIIYSHEHLKLGSLLATLATGSGKTVVMASVIAWLACQDDAPDTILLLCPNTIVRDRLRRDFESLEVFREFGLFPNEFKNHFRRLASVIVDSYQNCTNLLGKNLIVANRHQFQRGYQGGQNHLAFLQKEAGHLAVFNDEAHNTRGDEFARTLSILQPQTTFRLDVTATPDRADNRRPESNEIYNLSVVEAITGSYKSNRFMDRRFEKYPPLVKDVLVQRPSITTLGVIDDDDRLFSDRESGKAIQVRQIPWDQWTAKNSQIVMNPGPMKMQLQLSVEALELRKAVAKGRFKPLLFVIAPSIAGAEEARDMMKRDFGLDPLLVVDDETEYDKKELRDAAANLGSSSSPYDSVVSVYMLREGWDVPEVSVICLLRGFGSPLFAQQVLGRGLRLIRGKGVGTEDRSVQELTVIDHPALNLDYLWAEIDALVKEGDQVTRSREIERGAEEPVAATPKEPIEEQRIVRDELYRLLLPVPDPRSVESIGIARALELLKASLTQIKDFRPESAVIVEVESDGVDHLRPERDAIRSGTKRRVSALPNEPNEREAAQKRFTQLVMDWAEDYGRTYEAFSTHEDLVYKALLEAFEIHMFGGRHTTEVPGELLFRVQYSIGELKEAVTFELNRRFYGEELLLNER